MFGGFLSPIIGDYRSNTELSAKNVRDLDRVIRLQEVFTEELEKSKPGFIAGVGYFVDIAISDPIHSILGSATAPFGDLGDETFEEAAERVAIAKDLANLVYTDVTPEVFESTARGMINRVAEAGMLSDANPFYLQELISMVQEGGEGSTSALALGFQLADAAPVAASLLKSVGRAGAVPRVITKLRGQQAGVESRVRMAERGSGPAVAEMEPGITRVANEDALHLSAPELEARRQLDARNVALKVIRDTHDPSHSDPKILARAVDDLTVKIREQHGKKTSLPICLVT
jgi:hypothetical protein